MATNGKFEISIPQLRATDKSFESEFMNIMIKERSYVLEDMVLQMYVRGLSYRDVEDTFSKNLLCLSLTSY